VFRSRPSLSKRRVAVPRSGLGSKSRDLPAALARNASIDAVLLTLRELHLLPHPIGVLDRAAGCVLYPLARGKPTVGAGPEFSREIGRQRQSGSSVREPQLVLFALRGLGTTEPQQRVVVNGVNQSPAAPCGDVIDAL
jgi:hypothetical protein